MKTILDFKVLKAREINNALHVMISRLKQQGYQFEIYTEEAVKFEIAEVNADIKHEDAVKVMKAEAIKHSKDKILESSEKSEQLKYLIEDTYNLPENSVSVEQVKQVPDFAAIIQVRRRINMFSFKPEEYIQEQDRTQIGLDSDEIETGFINSRSTRILNSHKIIAASLLYKIFDWPVWKNNIITREKLIENLKNTSDLINLKDVIPLFKIRGKIRDYNNFYDALKENFISGLRGINAILKIFGLSIKATDKKSKRFYLHESGLFLAQKQKEELIIREFNNRTTPSFPADDINEIFDENEDELELSDLE
jgi:hypothetical protein